MPKARLRNKPEPRRAAATPQQWRALCQRALEAAQAQGDPRAGGLVRALTARLEQKTLQTLNIICDNDIEREFPSE